MILGDIIIISVPIWVSHSFQLFCSTPPRRQNIFLQYRMLRFEEIMVYLPEFHFIVLSKDFCMLGLCAQAL